MITLNDFQKIEIKIGKIKNAERIEGSEKLLRLEIDLGDESRQIVSGIGKAVTEPESLIGKEVPVITNLEPKQLMGMESQGIILAVSNGETPVLIHPEKEVPPGNVVK